MNSSSHGDQEPCGSKTYRRSTNFQPVIRCCKRNCFLSVSHEIQIREFESFQRKSNSKQFDQISDYLAAPPAKAKQRRWNYFVLIDSVEGVCVCKTFLINLLQISPNTISRVQRCLKKSFKKGNAINSRFHRVVSTKKYAPLLVCRMLRKFYEANGIHVNNIMRVFGGAHSLYKSFVEYYENAMTAKPNIDMKTFLNRYRDFLPSRR